MIVCLCRNINQARVLEAIEGGAETPHDVHRACGVEVNCGCCHETIEIMIGGARQAFTRAAQ